MATKKDSSTRSKSRKAPASSKGRKPAPKPAAKPVKPLTAEDFNWGTMFRGTREQLIAAKLLAPETNIPKKGGEATYWLPLNWSDGYNDACYGSRVPIPPRWTARASYSDEDDGILVVSAKFDWVRDMAVRRRAEAALALLDDLRAALERIPPEPLSAQIPRTIQQAKSWPDGATLSKQKEQRHAEREAKRRKVIVVAGVRHE